MKLTVGQIEQYVDHETEQNMLRIPVVITDEEGTVLLERHQAFPLSATEEEIKDFASRTLDVFKEGQANKAAHEAQQQASANAAEVASKISGLEIN